MPTSYESLIEEIAQIHETALADGDADWNKSVLVSNWMIGERIVEVEQSKAFRAKYGEKIIKLLRRPVLKLFTYRVGHKFSINLAHSVQNLDLGFWNFYGTET